MQKVNLLGFEERLRQERQRLGLSQVDFAEIGGVKRSTQHLYETGARVPDVNYLEAIRSSGADLEYLVLGERRPKRDGLNISHSTLTSMYRLVDEFSTNEQGVLLPLETRLRFFQMLCAFVSQPSFHDADISTLRAEMSRFLTD